MDSDQLKSFLAVARFKHFSLAAQELYISQSSLSKQIKALEKEVGVSLFNRTTRNVELTAAGEEFKCYASEIISIYNKLTSKMNFYSNANRSIINLGSISVANQYELPMLLSFFQQRYPNIKIRLIEDNVTNITKGLDQSKLHTAIITAHSLRNNLSRRYPLIFDELCLVVSKKHHLANKKIVDIIEAYDDEFLLLEKSSIYDITIEMLKDVGYLPKINIDNNKLETVISLVSENFGVSIITQKVVNWFNNPKISVIKIKNTPLVTTVLAINDNKKNTEEINIFRDFVMEWFRNDR